LRSLSRASCFRKKRFSAIRAARVDRKSRSRTSKRCNSTLVRGCRFVRCERGTGRRSL
jgi:hypothetical protein